MGCSCSVEIVSDHQHLLCLNSSWTHVHAFFTALKRVRLQEVEMQKPHSFFSRATKHNCSRFLKCTQCPRDGGGGCHPIPRSMRGLQSNGGGQILTSSLSKMELSRIQLPVPCGRSSPPIWVAAWRPWGMGLFVNSMS